MGAPETAPPPGIKIRPAVAADAEAICQAHYEALDRYHEFYGAFFKKHPRELLPLLTERAMKKTGDVGGNVFLVAEDEGGKGGDVVGFVRYSVEEAKEAEEKKEKTKKKEEEKGNEEESPYACKELLKPVWKAFNDEQAARDAMMEQGTKGQRHIWVHHLMIRPSHQRRGIGRALLSAVLRAADEARLATHIVSSAESFGLYSGMGFVSLGRWTIDNGRWAREVARAVPGPEGDALAERYDGVFEVEDVMVRAAGGRVGGAKG